MRASSPTAQGHSLTFTSRAAVLGLTLCAVVLLLAFPAKEYVGQRTAISAAQSQQRQLQAQIAQLTKEHASALTPAQIEAQARSELHDTLPGTRNYLTVQPPAPAAPKPVKAGNATVPINPDGTWYGNLLQSDTAAGS